LPIFDFGFSIFDSNSGPPPTVGPRWKGLGGAIENPKSKIENSFLALRSCQTASPGPIGRFTREHKKTTDFSVASLPAGPVCLALSGRPPFACDHAADSHEAVAPRIGLPPATGAANADPINPF
jgi:hypothetical protein